jgi:hypothetical protein
VAAQARDAPGALAMGAASAAVTAAEKGERFPARS